jgi:hypothetical protein
MTKAEKSVRALAKVAGEPFGSLLLFLYQASMFGDLQTLEACQWWADSLRTVADAVECDYGQKPDQAKTSVRPETPETPKETQ